MAYSIKHACANNNDELYTPKILVEAIEKYLVSLYKRIERERERERESKKPIIWLPFDTKDSEFAYLCRKLKFKYICSHIETGHDFFKYEPKTWDIALSNPPFSRKLDVFKRLNQLKKPWAMLMNIMALNYQIIGNYFSTNPCQLLIVDKRISFNGFPSSFNTSYVCGNNFLPKDLIFVHVENNNAKQNFVPSRMLTDFKKTKIFDKKKWQAMLYKQKKRKEKYVK